VRRLARELGVDMSSVPGSGPRGRITAADVHAFAQAGSAKAAPEETVAPVEKAEPSAAAATNGETSVTHDKFGPVERSKMSGIRRKTAEHMTHAWTTIPHVTHFDKADVSGFELVRKRRSAKLESVGTKLTITPILLKILGAALKHFPHFNASLDEQSQELILKKYYNIGVAVDTERGLLVPVVRDVDQKSAVDLAIEIARLAEKARARELTLEEMQGGTFTVTNLGGIGGTAFTPIINAPQVAILGVARARVEPYFENGQFVPRTMLPLALSYDHRAIDGADAARFLRWLAEAIEQPYWLLFQEPMLE
jgi:pyruvate dehydrogenase E2 component (dihydrolipoamide acetyltransferase)